jgi:hypothetical protein
MIGIVLPYHGAYCDLILKVQAFGINTAMNSGRSLIGER